MASLEIDGTRNVLRLQTEHPELVAICGDLKKGLSLHLRVKREHFHLGVLSLLVAETKRSGSSGAHIRLGEFDQLLRKFGNYPNDSRNTPYETFYRYWGPFPSDGELSGQLRILDSKARRDAPRELARRFHEAFRHERSSVGPDLKFSFWPERLGVDLSEVRSSGFDESALADSGMGKFTDSHVALLNRREVDAMLNGNYEERMARAEQLVCFSGLDCHQTLQDKPAVIESVLRRGLTVKVMLLSADPAIANTICLIDPDNHKPQQFFERLERSHKRCRDLAERYENFSYRLLPFLPPIGLFISDPPLGAITAEIYLLRSSDAQLGPRPVMVVERQSPWHSYFLRQWEGLWNVGTHRRTRNRRSKGIAQ